MRSEPLGKFFTLSDSSTAYQLSDSHRNDPFRRVLSMELLQFYYSLLNVLIRASTLTCKKHSYCLLPVLTLWLLRKTDKSHIYTQNALREVDDPPRRSSLIVSIARLTWGNTKNLTTKRNRTV